MVSGGIAVQAQINVEKVKETATGMLTVLAIWNVDKTIVDQDLHQMQIAAMTQTNVSITIRVLAMNFYAL